MQFFAASRLVIVAGKGGVGKTTVTAALATAAAGAGLRTLVVEVEGKSGLGQLLGADGELDYEEVTVPARARARTAPARSGPAPSPPTTRSSSTSTTTACAAWAAGSCGAACSTWSPPPRPGIDDILVLGKVKQLERAGTADLILLDAPAAGHAITFLQSATGLLDAVTVGPINTQARDVLEMLSDPTRSQVVLVTLPEETPVNELVETAYALEDRVGLSLGPVVVNGLYPDDSTASTATPPPRPRPAGVACRRRRPRGAGARPPRSAGTAPTLQREQVARLAERLPLPQIHLPVRVHRRARRGRDRASWPTTAGRAPGPRRMTAGDGRAAATTRRADAALGAPGRRARDHHLLRLGRRRQDHDRGRHRPRGRPGRGRRRASSPSIRPSAWPTRSASPAGSPTSPAGSTGPGRASCGR